MKSVDPQVFVLLLNEALVSPEQRRELMARYEELAGEVEIANATPAQIEAIRDLGHDAAFYSTDSKALREDSALFGDDELLRRIRAVLRRF